MNPIQSQMPDRKFNCPIIKQFNKNQNNIPVSKNLSSLHKFNNAIQNNDNNKFIKPIIKNTYVTQNLLNNNIHNNKQHNIHKTQKN
jgi:hypothetical protein